LKKPKKKEKKLESLEVCKLTFLMINNSFNLNLNK
jgi:hypothetical protein